MTVMFASPGDVADIWRPLTDAETTQVASLIVKASARLRQKCPFDVDDRIALHSTDPKDPRALDPMIVADVVAGIVKRALVNPDGATSLSETAGSFSQTKGFGGQGNQPVNTLVVLDSDIDQLRPARNATTATTIRIGAGEPPDRAFERGGPYRRRRA